MARRLHKLSAGDVGLVRLRHLGPTGAIWTGRRWAVKTTDGVMLAHWPLIAAWRVPASQKARAHLPAFLAQAAGRPFVFGETDCAMTVADWVASATGRDPGATLRGRYRTRFGWLRLATRAGGMCPLFDGLARGAGLKRIY